MPGIECYQEINPGSHCSNQDGNIHCVFHPISVQTQLAQSWIAYDTNTACPDHLACIAKNSRNLACDIALHLSYDLFGNDKLNLSIFCQQEKRPGSPLGR